MNPILAYEQEFISFSELEKAIWDMGPNLINEIGEKCFEFYCRKANELHDYDYYILTYGSGLDADNEWYCD